VRVHLVGIAALPGGEANQAALLKQEADHVCDLSLEEVDTFMTCRPAPAVAPMMVPSGGPSTEVVRPASAASVAQLADAELAAIVDAALGQMNEDSIRQVVSAGRYSIPLHLDGLLLTTATKLLGGRVPDGAKKQLRGAFFAACQKRVGG
jgi:hypothetical protein